MPPTANAERTAAANPKSTTADPIDALLPRPYRWWVRLAIASAIIAAVSVIGFAWNFGLIRPSPDCCGSGSSGTQIGLANQPDAVVVNMYFFNSSRQAISIDDAAARLLGATVLDVAPFTGHATFESPPENLGEWPIIVEGNGDIWMAITFAPDRCSDDGADWGTVTLNLSVAEDHWYPTLGRSFDIAAPVVAGQTNQLGVLPPARLDDAFSGNEGPLEAACILLER